MWVFVVAALCLAQGARASVFLASDTNATSWKAYPAPHECRHHTQVLFCPSEFTADVSIAYTRRASFTEAGCEEQCLLAYTCVGYSVLSFSPPVCYLYYFERGHDKHVENAPVMRRTGIAEATFVRESPLSPYSSQIVSLCFASPGRIQQLVIDEEAHVADVGVDGYVQRPVFLYTDVRHVTLLVDIPEGPSCVGPVVFSGVPPHYEVGRASAWAVFVAAITWAILAGAAIVVAMLIVASRLSSERHTRNYDPF